MFLSLWFSLWMGWTISIHGFSSASFSTTTTFYRHQQPLDRRRQLIETSSSSSFLWLAASSSSSSSSSRSRDSGSGSGGGGMGMGRASAATTNKKKKKKPTTRSTSTTTASTDATTTATTTPFDVAASVLRLEKQYDQLLLEASKRIAAEQDDDDEDDNDVYNGLDDSSRPSTFEFVIAARDGNVLPDWVPIAQLILVVKGSNCCEDVETHVSSQLLQAAVSTYCRELHHVAGLASNTFRTIVRQNLQYAIEPADSFYKHVYDKVVEPPPPVNQMSMSNVEARKVLRISQGGTLHDLKLRYRQRSMECHPDRVRHAPSHEQEQSEEEFSRVKLAYETLLGSGSMRRGGTTWYESLGGRERTDFSKIELLSLKQAAAAATAANNVNGEDGGGAFHSAIMGLEPSLVQSFVARSRASKQQ